MVRFADAVIEASDGTVYFSDASTRFGFDRWFLACLESRHTGRLLKYDPRTGKASVVLNNLAFANGVALPRDEAFVIVCESAGYFAPAANNSVFTFQAPPGDLGINFVRCRYRCLKLWLKGDKAGQTETFVDLPGSPDNIRRAPDGSFWIDFIQVLVVYQFNYLMQRNVSFS
jgi:sugar lactone lactonase YvrE